MSIIKKVFESMRLKDLVDKYLHNNWANTPFKDYPRMDPKGKGAFGEDYVEGLMTFCGRTVSPPANTGHDRIIDIKKTEIKFSLANSNSKKKDGKLIDPDSFTFNHIAAEKDWEEFIFLGINPELDNPNIRTPKKMTTWPIHRAYKMNKADFLQYLYGGENNVFKKQQGGKKSDNDDYMVTGRSGFYKLINLSFIEEIDLGDI